MNWPSPETTPTAVFDTSPLVFLDVLAYADLLPELFEVVIPPQVNAELRKKEGEVGSRVPDRSWVSVRSPKAEVLGRTARELGAGAGENAAISLAQELEATVVLDDLKARRYARSKDLEVVGTLGILVLIHRLGRATRTPEAEFDLLEAHGMWLSTQVKAGALQALRAQ